MKRKVLGWNINQRTGLGKEIPELVLQELLEQDADVIVLTEVVKNNSLSVFLQKMREAGYESAISKNENTNEVCILWKREYYQLLNVDDSLITAKENDNPNYLMVELKDQNDKKFNVVGYRIRVGRYNYKDKREYEFRARQMKIVTEKLALLNGPTMVVTDSNNLCRGATRKEWNLSVLDSMLSEVEFNRNTPEGSSIFADTAVSPEYEFAEDHIITKGVDVTDVLYDRDFVKRDVSVYKWGKDFSERIEGTNKYRQIRVGFPDHAIIKGYFRIAQLGVIRKDGVNMERKVIAVDFDGTLCMNKDAYNWPYLGPPNMELVSRLKRLQSEGHILILWTCRDGESLVQAVKWCRDFCGITFDAINDNIEATKKFFGGNSRKISCDYYIDDKGCTPEVFYSYLN